MNDVTVRLDLADGNWNTTTGMTSDDVGRLVATWLSGVDEEFTVLGRNAVFTARYSQIDEVHITR